MNTGKLHAVADPAAQPDLVARCQRGEKEALGELYRLYRADVARNLHRMLGPGRGDLEDVLQEVFIEVFRSIARFRGDAKITTWLYRVTERVARSERRRVATARRLERQPEARAPGVRPDEDLERQDARHTVYRVLETMREKYRTVFVLFELEGLSGEQISALLCARTETVWVWLHRARAQFLRGLEDLQRREGLAIEAPCGLVGEVHKR